MAETAAVPPGRNCSGGPVGLPTLLDKDLDYTAQAAGIKYRLGLYVGTNLRPRGHDMRGRDEAMQVQPLNATGARPAPGSGPGKIGFATIGFSGTHQVSRELLPLLAAMPRIRHEVETADCALAGSDIDDILDLASPYWLHVRAMLDASGLTPAQVQVAWMQSGRRGKAGTTPDEAIADLEARWIDGLRAVKTFFPNLRLLYVCGPAFHGYMPVGSDMEPWAFEQNLATQRVIMRQVSGFANLNYLAQRGPVVAPWVAWGGYCWADGPAVREDGFAYVCPRDVAPDGIHPSVAGAQKIAALLADNIYDSMMGRIALFDVPHPGAASGSGSTSQTMTV